MSIESMIDANVASMPIFTATMADQVAANVSDDGPEPGEGGIPIDAAPIPPSQSSPSNDTDSQRDSAGVPFNPSVHFTDKNGKGFLTKEGRWRRKPPGVKGGSAKVPPPPPAPDMDRATYERSCRELAKLAVGTVTSSMTMILGDDWVPSGDEESSMVKHWGDYFVAAGIITVPAWLPPLVVTAMYVAPRVNMPKTQERMRRIYVKLGMRKKVTNNAPA